MNIIQELQELRTKLINDIDESMEQLLQKLQNNPEFTMQESFVMQRDFECLYPLHAGLGIFKGKRPTGVLFPDHSRIETPTWKKVAEVILAECNKNATYHQALMNLRGKVLGRNRVLLGSEIGNMRSPVKIDEALYLETHYDAETLLRIITSRILNEIGYNYNEIKIAVKIH